MESSLLAQIGFTAQVTSISGNCNSSWGAIIFAKAAKSSAEHISTVSFADCAECEQYRIYWISEWSGSYDGCVVRVTASPCTPCDKSNANGINILAPQQGSSFYSTNPANEVADWISDDIERLLALNPNALNNNENSEYSKAKNGLRNSGSWFLDADKPFVSTNMRQGGFSETGSENMSMVNTEWNYQKSSRKLPDANIHEYKERMLSEANQRLEDLLKKSNMSIGQLKQFMNDCEFMLNNTIIKQNADYQNELIYLEKALLLAKFTEYYRATQNQISYEKLDGNKSADAAFEIMHDGKTQEDLHLEDLKKKETELLSAGISQEVIDKIKQKADNTTLRDVFLGLGEVNPYSVLGVVIKDMISLASDKKISDAISNQIEERKKQQEEQEKWNKDQQNKIQAINDVLEIHTNKSKNKMSRMSEKEMLDWSIKIDDTMSKMKQQSKDDYYGEFPDINKNKLIGRENVIFLNGNF